MSELKKRTCCVVDHGLFTEWAVLLAKDFGKVYYWTPWQDGYPRSNSLLIGTGLPNVVRLKDFWSILDEIDIFVFPDCYLGPLQCHLASLGKRVWGSRRGEDLELDRVASKKHQERIGIDIGPWRVVRGLAALREHLKESKNQWVKISATRGDMETFKSKNYKLIEPKLDELEEQLGAKKYSMEFIVEDDIPDAVEIGYDGFNIRGKFPKQAMAGIEIKDKGLVMKTMTYAALPEEIRDVNDKLGPTLREFDYRGFLSTELRITRDHKAYSIDPCARAGSPPNELYQLLITNWADIIWEGANGVVVDPIFAAKWGAELLLISDWAKDRWQAVQFPKSIRENVKLRNLAVIEGQYYSVPQVSGHAELGAVVALGNTMDEAIAECKKLAAQVEGYYVETVSGCLDEAQGEFKKLAEFGVKV
jgi:hypothetical protein